MRARAYPVGVTRALSEEYLYARRTGLKGIAIEGFHKKVVNEYQKGGSAETQLRDARRIDHRFLLVFCGM